MKTQIKKFLNAHLNEYTPIPFKVIGITDLLKLTDDPGNELLYMVKLQPKDPNVYWSEHEPCINIRGLNNRIQDEDMANGDYCVTVEHYIGINTAVLLPITFLK